MQAEHDRLQNPLLELRTQGIVISEKLKKRKNTTDFKISKCTSSTTRLGYRTSWFCVPWSVLWFTCAVVSWICCSMVVDIVSSWPITAENFPLIMDSIWESRATSVVYKCNNILINMTIQLSDWHKYSAGSCFIGCGRGLFCHLGTKFYLTVFAMENHCYKGENITINMKVQVSKWVT